jgi:hypothetical protein
MPCSIPASQLSAWIAQQIGKARAFVIGKVMEQVNKITEQLSGDSCPPVEELEKILAIRDNLVQVIDNFEKKIEPIKQTAESLDPPIKSAKITVTVLEQLAILTTVGVPPPLGGVIFSLPVKVTNKFAQLLSLSCQFVDMLEKDQSAIKELTQNATVFIQPVKAKLNSIDVKLEGCVNKLPSDQRNKFLKLIGEQPPAVEEGDTVYRSKSGNNYVIVILEDKQPNLPAPKRYAAVKDITGVIVLKGESSFSSSTKVLIDEIKFRIENQLP